MGILFPIQLICIIHTLVAHCTIVQEANQTFYKVDLSLSHWCVKCEDAQGCGFGHIYPYYPHAFMCSIKVFIKQNNVK